MTCEFQEAVNLQCNVLVKLANFTSPTYLELPGHSLDDQITVTELSRTPTRHQQ